MTQITAIVETADPKLSSSSNELIERVALEATRRFGKCYIRSRTLDNGKIQWWVDKRGRIAFAAHSLEELSRMIQDGLPPAANGIAGKNYTLASAQAAGILGVQPGSMTWFIHKRGLPHLKVYSKTSTERGRILYDKDEILDWMKANSVKPAIAQRGTRKKKHAKVKHARVARPAKNEHEYLLVNPGVEHRLNDLVARMGNLMGLDAGAQESWRLKFIENAIKRALDIAEGR